ncbi:MAK10-like protein [Tanacetum coccineum]
MVLTYVGPRLGLALLSQESPDSTGPCLLRASDRRSKSAISPDSSNYPSSIGSIRGSFSIGSSSGSFDIKKPPIFSSYQLFRNPFSSTTIGDENPIRTLGDYSRPSHEGYRNTIELPEGNNVVPLRSDAIRLVQNGYSFYGLRSEYPNQHLKDFLKLVDSLDLDGSISTWEDLTTRLLAQFFPPGRTAKLRSDILMFQQHHGESLSEAWTHFKDLLQKAITLPQDVPSTSDRRLIELENKVQRLMQAHLALTQPTQVNKITTPCEICNGPHGTHNCTKGPEQACVDYASSHTNEIRGKKFTSNHGPRNFNDVANTWKDKPNFNRAHTQSFTSPQGGSISVHSSSYQMKLEKALLDFDSNQEKSTDNDTEEGDTSSTNACNLDLGGMAKGKEELKEQGKGENEMEANMEVEEESKFETNEEIEEIIKEEEDDRDGEYFNSFPTMMELTHHKWLLKNPRPPWVKARIKTRSPNNTKISCMIGHFFIIHAYIDLESPINIMSRSQYNQIMTYEHTSRQKPSNPKKISNFVGRIRGLKIFIGSFTYKCDFMTLEDTTSIIDRHLGEIVFGKPFIEETGLVNDEEKGTIMFEQGDGKITFKMPYTMEIFKQTRLMGLSTDSIPPSAHEENFGHGKTHYYQSLLIRNEYK